MMNFSFEEANKLDWSNKPINFVIALRLLLMTYDERPEAEDFRRRRNEIKEKCLVEIDDLPGLVKELRTAFPVGPYGRSREETDQTLSDFLANLYSAVFHSLSKQSGLELSDIDFANIDFSGIEDPVLRDATQKYFAWVKQYAEDYEQYGGTWMPDPKIMEKAMKRPSKSSNEIELFSDPRMLRLIQYRHNLTKLCYEYGLKCWWAPDIYYCDDLTRWAGPVPVEEMASPNLDGILGPLFKREISDTLKEHPGDITMSQYGYKEWLLFAMSRKEMRRDFGIKHTQEIHEKMESWKFHHNNKWEQTDFNMLFDRLYLRISLKNIAEKYYSDVAVVQRHTSYLAELLGLELPRAPHQEQLQH